MSAYGRDPGLFFGVVPITDAESRWPGRVGPGAQLRSQEVKVRYRLVPGGGGLEGAKRGSRGEADQIHNEKAKKISLCLTIKDGGGERRGGKGRRSMATLDTGRVNTPDAI